MNYMTIVLSYEYICKNISLHFFHWYTNFALLVQNLCFQRGLEALFWEGSIFHFQYWERQRITQEVVHAYILKLHFWSSWALFMIYVRIHSFCRLQARWDLHVVLHEMTDTKTVLFLCLSEISQVLLPLELQQVTAQGSHNCFHKISRWKGLEQPCWYRSWWWQVLKVQNIK